MKLKLLGILFAFVTAAHGAAIVPDAQETKAAHMAAELLSRYHYKPTQLDESLSSKIFDQYLKALDSEKLFFTQADIDQMAEARTKLGAETGPGTVVTFSAVSSSWAIVYTSSGSRSRMWYWVRQRSRSSAGGRRYNPRFTSVPPPPQIATAHV